MLKGRKYWHAAAIFPTLILKIQQSLKHLYSYNDKDIGNSSMVLSSEFKVPIPVKTPERFQL